MPSSHQRSVTPLLSCALLSCVAALAVALGVVPDAQALGPNDSATFSVTVQVLETAQSTTTSTDPNNQGPLVCTRESPDFNTPDTTFTVPQPPPFAASQTTRLRTTKAQSVNVWREQSGLVQLSSSLSSGQYAEIPGIVGTIERHNNNPPTVEETCAGTPASATDCGTKSPKQWRLTLDRISSSRKGREQLQGLGVNFDTPNAQPFGTCDAPQVGPPGFSSSLAGNLAKIDAQTLFDRSRRQIVLNIKGTIPFRHEDKESQTVTEGTYFRSITLTLRRTG
jgi:hypothetical protein